MLLKAMRQFSSKSKLLREGQFNAGGHPMDFSYDGLFERAFKDPKYIKEINSTLKSQNICVVLEKTHNSMRSKSYNLYRAICGHLITKNSRNMFLYLFKNIINVPKNMSYVVNITEYWKNQEAIYRFSKYLEKEIFAEDLDYIYDCKEARKLIASYFRDRDGVNIDPSSIVLTNDQIKGLDLILDLVIDSENCGVMMARPFITQWNDLVSYKQGRHVFYSLDYKTNWSINIEEISQQYEEAKAAGINPKVLLLSNPNDLTGSVMQRENIEELLRFCYEKNLLLFVDESNGYITSDNSNFTSVRKIMQEMPEPIKNNLQVVVSDSIKSSFLLDIGFRAAHMELVNFDHQACQMIREISDLNPPPFIDLNIMLILYVTDSVKMTAQIIDEEFAESADHSSNQLAIETRLKQVCFTKMAQSMSQGAIPEFMAGCHYLIKLDFPPKFIEFAKSQDKGPDRLFCEILFQDEKILATPGSAFGCETPDFIRVLRLSFVDIAFMDVLDRMMMTYERTKEDFQ